MSVIELNPTRATTGTTSTKARVRGVRRGSTAVPGRTGGPIPTGPAHTRAPHPVATPTRPVRLRPTPCNGVTRPAAIEEVRVYAEPLGALRLTRRGRVVVTLFLLGLVLAASALIATQSAATAHAGTPVPTRTVVVDRGDTLWGIASTVPGDRDPRDVVHQIEELNSLPGPALTEGQKLAVPLR
jgi:LysM repeat protein